MKHLHNAFLENGHSEKEISRALHPSHKQPTDKKTDTKSAFLPYIHGITDLIGRILEKHKNYIQTQKENSRTHEFRKGLKGPENI